jgi:hypothetical protein
MSYFADDVDLNISVPFATCSDAKLAALVLTDSVPVYAVDLFINAIRDHNFHAGEITYECADDIPSDFSSNSPTSRAHSALTASDQHFVSFVTQGNITASSANTFLRLLQDGKFDPEEVSLENAAEIFECVARHRRQAAVAREQIKRSKPFEALKFWKRVANSSQRREDNNSDSTPCARALYNLDILEVILEQVVLQRSDRIRLTLSSDERIRDDARREAYLLRKTLEYMTLVHRMWTIPAQNALGSAVRITGISSARKALCNPFIGASTRRAYILCWCADFDQRRDMEWMVARTYHHLVNLRKLAIDLKLSEERDVKNARCIVEGITTLPRLEELYVDVNGVRSLLLLVCQTISPLENIRKIGIKFQLYRGHTWRNAVEDRKLIDLRQLPCKVEDIRFSVEGEGLIEGLIFAASILEWFFIPREWRVRALNFRCDTDSGDVCMRFFQPILSSLESLHSLELHTGVAFSASEESLQFYRTIIARCKALQCMRICVGYGDDRSVRDAHYELMKYKPATLTSDRKCVRLSSDRIWIPGGRHIACAPRTLDLEVGDCALKQHDYTLVGWDQRCAYHNSEAFIC